MQIRFDKVGEEPISWDETLKIDAASLERDELVELGEIVWRGTVYRDGGGFPLDGQADYDQTVACVRCLTPIVDRVTTQLHLLVLNREADAAEGEIELSTEDLEVLYCPGEILDTGLILHEQLQLNIPMRALCAESCQGLGPTCGQNRNESGGDCEAKSTDPRWEVLRGLKE